MMTKQDSISRAREVVVAPARQWGRGRSPRGYFWDCLSEVVREQLSGFSFLRHNRLVNDKSTSHHAPPREVPTLAIGRYSSGKRNFSKCLTQRNCFQLAGGR